jgi:peroxiredoxin Q/BCP
MKRLLFSKTAVAALLFLVQFVAAAGALDVGQPAPEFELPDQQGQLHSLEDYRDQWVVLYFYPKDETPGCTTEACEFRDNIFAYRKLNAQILGVSLDDVESHRKFAENHSLPFPLLADTEGAAADAYGVKTKMMGWTVAKRQTFLIDPDGNIARHYEKVDPDEHSAQVLADLESLGAGR